MDNRKRKSDPDNRVPIPRKRTLAKTLTLTATLAALGTSLGVDVEALFAAEPKLEEGKSSPGGGATQIKIGEPEGATQRKWKVAPTGSLLDNTKKKSPAAVQDKTKGTPTGAPLPKADEKAGAGQGNFKAAVPPSDAMKQNPVQSNTMKQNAVQSEQVRPGRPAPGQGTFKEFIPPSDTMKQQ